MIVLSAQHVAKAFGGTDILKDASVTLQQRERIGLVGVNGCGKSTFLKILTGELQADSGTISLAKQLRLGYLAQQSPLISGQTVYQVMDAVFEPVREMEARLRDLEARMAGSDEQELARLGEQYTRLNTAFEDAGGYDYRSRIQGVLKGLGFDEAMQAIMIALYITMDSFGTACNVTGDGAIALIVDKINGKKHGDS